MGATKESWIKRKEKYGYSGVKDNALRRERQRQAQKLRHSRNGGHSEATKIKIGINSGKARKGKLYPNSGQYKKGRILSKEVDEKRIRNLFKVLRKRPTGLERKMIWIIQKYNLPYRYVGDGSFLIGYKNPDFINTNGEKIAIEVYEEKIKEMTFGTVERWKSKRIKEFHKFGWKILFFNRSEVTKNNISKILGELI